LENLEKAHHQKIEELKQELLTAKEAFEKTQNERAEEKKNYEFALEQLRLEADNLRTLNDSNNRDLSSEIEQIKESIVVVQNEKEGLKVYIN